MSKSVLIKFAAVGGACAAVGAGAGILGTAAASTSDPSAPAHARVHRHAGLAPRELRRAVHADAVIPVKGGRFIQITFDRGVVQSVSGQQLTIAEGARKHTYKDVTLTIPASAIVRDDRRSAQLSQLKPGQSVGVLQGPRHTYVTARTPKRAA